MEKQFATYSISLELKELGFDEKCFAEYNDNKILLIYYPPNYDYGYCTVNNYDGTNFDNEGILAPLWQQVWSFLDDNGVIIGMIFVDNVFKYTLNINSYVSNEFKDRMSAIKSATEHATSYLWDKKFNK